MAFGHFIDYLPSLSVLSITWADSPQHPLQEGRRLTGLRQNSPSTLTHLREDLAGMANVVDSWLPSATDEQLNWTHTTASASPVYVSTVGCTLSLMYQAGITCKQSLELSGLPLYPPSKAYTVVLFHSDHCGLT